MFLDIKFSNPEFFDSSWKLYLMFRNYEINRYEIWISYYLCNTISGDLDNCVLIWPQRASQEALVVKNPPDTAGNLRDAGSIPGSGRSSRRGGHGNPLWYSCWEIPWTEEPGGLQSMGSPKSQTWWKWLSTHVWPQQTRVLINTPLYTV